MNEREFLINITELFQSYKTLGEKALNQLHPEEFTWSPDPDSNSTEILIKHLHGNMLSRWTDFLNSDGEKPNRNRDDEFEPGNLDKGSLMHLWNEGWNCLLSTLYSLTDDDLDKTVFIRGEAHTVQKAIVRQIAHYSYHVGQIVYVAKMIRKSEWENLSIKKGESNKFNQEKFGNKS